MVQILTYHGIHLPAKPYSVHTPSCHFDFVKLVSPTSCKMLHSRHNAPHATDIHHVVMCFIIIPSCGKSGLVSRVQGEAMRGNGELHQNAKHVCIIFSSPWYHPTQPLLGFIFTSTQQYIGGTSSPFTHVVLLFGQKVENAINTTHAFSTK